MNYSIKNTLDKNEHFVEKKKKRYEKEQNLLQKKKKKKKIKGP